MTDDRRTAICKLQEIIDANLRPLITGDYALIDAPYYHNIGDVLIWQGIHDFCKSLPGRNLGASNITTFRFPDYSPEVTLLLMGGGNFGDLWRPFQDFRLKIIRRYPNNRIIVFPQSVWYDNQRLIAEDADTFTSHKNLILCARDTFSYNFLTSRFKGCNILLVPDMAYYINPSIWDSYKIQERPRKLFLKRLDKELAEVSVKGLNPDEYDVHDWPTYEKTDWHLWLVKRLEGIFYRTQKFRPLASLFAALTDMAAKHCIRRHLVSTGIRFLQPYSEIVTTRLHTMILGSIMGKYVEYIDNTTGKLSAFASCWLKDFDDVKKFER